MFYFTKQKMKNQGQDSPVESKPNQKKRGWCIGILVHKLNKRHQGTYKNNLNR